jgi:cytochrome P450
MAQHHNVKSGTFDVSAINSIPIIQSIQTEIGRLRIGTVVARTSIADVMLDDSWTVPKGQSITIFNHDISHNTEMWEKVRPRALAKPLHEFFAERFLIPNKSTSVSESSSGKIPDRSDMWKGKYSTEGLSSLLLTFGGGQSLCPGRFFVKATQAGTLAVLLSEFEMEFSDSRTTERVLPLPMQVAYGPIKPLERISLRIRRRDIPEIQK